MKRDDLIEQMVSEATSQKRVSPALLLAVSTGIALALTVALSIKIVGALLIAALLIIPPAAARSLSRTPEGMAVVAVLAGAVSVVAGLAGSLGYDTPAGPSIVVAAFALFLLSLLAPARR